ncbi:MAG TPA: hypothetical protein VMM12_01855 [Longimicrobiales bacterium]|nr:hypothetical protein [Longimicrobiales bacterium]
MADQHETSTGAEGAGHGKGGKVKEAAHQAQEKVSDLAATAREKGEDLAEQGKEKAEELAHRAGDMARSRAEEEKDRVAGGIRTVADALRRGGEDLPEDRQGYGRFVEAVADRADGVSRYLQDRDVDDLTRDVQRFAREHTPVFLSGAFALGMMGARFLKSSSESGRDASYPVSRGYAGGGYSGGYASSKGYIGPVATDGLQAGDEPGGGGWESAGAGGPETGSAERTGGENA